MFYAVLFPFQKSVPTAYLPLSSILPTSLLLLCQWLFLVNILLSYTLLSYILYLQAPTRAEYIGKEYCMNLEQRANDIGIAFATCKMNSRDNSDDDVISRQTQFMNFITDYSFAVSEIAVGKAEMDILFKD